MWVLLGALASVARGLGEVAGGDDDAVLVHLERAAQLGDDRRADVPLPFLGLHRRAHLGQAGGAIDAGHVNPAVRAVRRHLDRVLVEAHLDQQVADERLEAFGRDALQELRQPGARAAWLISCTWASMPLGCHSGQAETAVAGAHEVGAFLLGVGVEARAHRRFGRQALGRDQLLGQRALGDLLVVERLARGLEDGVGGVEVGHGEIPFESVLTAEQARDILGAEKSLHCE